MSDQSTGEGCTAIVKVLFWTVVFGVLDAFAVVEAAQELRSLGFARTDGVVTVSRMVVTRGKGGGRHFDLAYEYTVNGRAYTGTGYLSFPPQPTRGADADDALAELPVGTAVAVYYDPVAPADATLHPGLSGKPLYMLWFMIPFNVIGFGQWLELFRGRQFDPTRVVQTGSGCAVELPGTARLTVFLIALIPIALIGLPLLGLAWDREPSLAVMGVAFPVGFALAAGLAALFGRHPRLEVDTFSRTLRFFPYRRSAGVSVPFGDAKGVDVVREERRQKGGPVAVFHCDLRRAGGEGPLRLATFRAQDDADACAAWVRSQITHK